MGARIGAAQVYSLKLGAGLLVSEPALLSQICEGHHPLLLTNRNQCSGLGYAHHTSHAPIDNGL